VHYTAAIRQRNLEVKRLAKKRKIKLRISRAPETEHQEEKHASEQAP
jgi:hypothetical protein